MRGVVGDLAAGGRHPAVNAAKTDSKLSNFSVVARLTRGALPKGGGEIAAPAPFFTKPPGRRARFSRSPSPPGDVSTIHTFDFHGGDAVVMHQSTTDTCVGSARCKDIRSELCIPVQVRSFVSRFLKLRLTYTGTADALQSPGLCLARHRHTSCAKLWTTLWKWIWPPCSTCITHVLRRSGTARPCAPAKMIQVLDNFSELDVEMS